MLDGTATEEQSFKTQKEVKDKYVFYVPETSFRDKLVRIGAMMGMSETARYQRDLWQQVESALHMGKIVALDSNNSALMSLVDQVWIKYQGTSGSNQWQFIDAPDHRTSPAKLPFVSWKGDNQYPPLYWLYSTSEETYSDQDFITIRGYVSGKDGDNALIEKVRYAIWSVLVQKAYNHILDDLEKIIFHCSEYLNVRQEVEDLRDEIKVAVGKLMNSLEYERDMAIDRGKELFKEHVPDWGDDISYFATVNVIRRGLPKEMHVDIMRWSYDANKMNNANDFGSFSSFGGIKSEVDHAKDEHLFAKLTHDRMYNLQIMASIAHDSALNNESPTTAYRKFGEIVQYIGQGIEQLQKSNSSKSEGGAKYEKYEWWTPDFAINYNEVLNYYINIKYAMENNFLTTATQDEMNIYLNMNFIIEQSFLMVNRWVRRAVEFILQRKMIDQTKSDGLGAGEDWTKG